MALVVATSSRCTDYLLRHSRREGEVGATVAYRSPRLPMEGYAFAQLACELGLAYYRVG